MMSGEMRIYDRRWRSIRQTRRNKKMFINRSRLIDVLVAVGGKPRSWRHLSACACQFNLFTLGFTIRGVVSDGHYNVGARVALGLPLRAYSNILRTILDCTNAWVWWPSFALGVWPRYSLTRSPACMAASAGCSLCSMWLPVIRFVIFFVRRITLVKIFCSAIFLTCVNFWLHTFGLHNVTFWTAHLTFWTAQIGWTARLE